MGKPVVHFEIGCRDKSTTLAFYTKLFDWSSEDMGPSTMIRTGSDQGIQGHITSLGHEPHNYVMVYVQVDDLDAYVGRVSKLGGKTLIGPIDIPEQGSFAWIADPEGNMIGLWKPQPA